MALLGRKGFLKGNDLLGGRAKARKVSFSKSLRRPNYLINSFDKFKLEGTLL